MEAGPLGPHGPWERLGLRTGGSWAGAWDPGHHGPGSMDTIVNGYIVSQIQWNLLAVFESHTPELGSSTVQRPSVPSLSP